ncbi:DUF4157 domain-containing protein [uncultured Roseobacter sp.]|uniref:eCIS core domain-containing protein n=1 Tax=uncultured Roseobacter sp. TaxID=114847 RepID=UPI00263543F6|nr:DUF4157 domain-containing protein [uncultured Roseobacter sp.]
MAHIFASDRAQKPRNAAQAASRSVAGSPLENLQQHADASGHPQNLKSLQRAAEPVQRMEDEEMLQGKAKNGSLAADPVQLKAGDGSSQGLPASLQSGVEQLSGVDMSGVQVLYNSSRPAQLQAHAYAQGQAIHLGPGQETHLPHEAWHVAQQAQGRVQPNGQVAGQALNDDAGLEREADVMGARAMQEGNALERD